MTPARIMGTVNNLEQYELGPGAVFDVERFAMPDLGIALEPTFTLDRSDLVLVMGSCFAVRVREALQSIGFAATDGGLELKYNAFAMLQEVRWCLHGGFGAAQVLRTPDGRWFNPHRHPAKLMATRAEALDVHLEAQRAAGAVLREARTMVLTYGLIEAWFDRFTGLYTNEAPAMRELPSARARFELHQLTHAQNVDAILGLVRCVRAVNPGMRFIASVSPIPLKATFCGNDVLVSNCVSKSTLRSALHEALASLRAEGASIDYFPSYEIVSLAPVRDAAWHARFPDGRPDGRHVRADFVERAILPPFLRAYAAEAVRAPLSAHDPLVQTRGASTDRT